MEVIEVADGFTLDKEDAPGNRNGSAAAAVTRGAKEREDLNSRVQQENTRMFASVGANLPPAPRPPPSLWIYVSIHVCRARMCGVCGGNQETKTLLKC